MECFNQKERKTISNKGQKNKSIFINKNVNSEIKLELPGIHGF